MIRLSIALCIVLVGCVPPQRIDKRAAFQAKVSSWIGRNINEAIREMGPASRQVEMPNGNVVMVWERSKQGVISMPAYGGQGTIQTPISRSCSIQLEYGPSQIVTFAKSEGNGCI